MTRSAEEDLNVKYTGTKTYLEIKLESLTIDDLAQQYLEYRRDMLMAEKVALSKIGFPPHVIISYRRRVRKGKKNDERRRENNQHVMSNPEWKLYDNFLKAIAREEEAFRKTEINKYKELVKTKEDLGHMKWLLQVSWTEFSQGKMDEAAFVKEVTDGVGDMMEELGETFYEQLDKEFQEKENFLYRKDKEVPLAERTLVEIIEDEDLRHKLIEIITECWVDVVTDAEGSIEEKQEKEND